jgi:CRISPR-associated DxTHG motif protein
MVTLVSFIGRGQPGPDGQTNKGYRKTKYYYEDKTYHETSIFLNCLLAKKEFKPDELVLIGTETSSWGALLEENLKKNGEEDKPIDKFYEELYYGFLEKKPITFLELENIEKYLLEIHHIPVKCYMHKPDIEGNEMAKVISLYEDIVAKIPSENSVRIDTTHSLRSMPFLFMSAINARYAGTKTAQVSFVYGEWDGVKGKVVDLSQSWNLLKRSFAISGFVSRFNSGELGDLVEAAGWKHGAGTINLISRTVQSNFFDQLPTVMDELKKSLSKFPSAAPLWICEIKKILEEIMKCSDNNATPAQISLAFAEMLAKKEIIGAAILCLQCAVEQKLTTDYLTVNPGDDKFIGIGNDAYDNFKKFVMKPFYYHKTKGVSNSILSTLEKLNYVRNDIGHYGKSFQSHTPQPAELGSKYRAFSNAVKSLLEIEKIQYPKRIPA